jgi:hemerythrin
MLTWNDHASDPEIEVEHHALYARLAKLEPVIVDGQRDASVARAVHILFERMARHFAMEEELAMVSSPQACSALKHDHFEILGILARLRAVPCSWQQERQRLYREFRLALAKHDREVDVPVFQTFMH